MAGFFLPTVIGVVLPLQCFAHVKWFAEPSDLVEVPTFSRMEIVAALTLLMLGAVIARLLHQKVVARGGLWCSPLSETTRPLGVSHYLLSIYFLGCALSGFILAPHITAAPAIIYLCVAAQSVVSVLLLLNRFRELTALLILGLFIIAGVTDTTFLAEYLLLMGIAWVIYFSKQIPELNVIVVLRWSLGLSLIALALMEKLLQPELAVNVLNQYPLNFMRHLGIPFSDLWFVLAAGTVELLIGVLFLFGWLVRTTTLVLLALMIASNSYFLMVGNHPLAIMELIGHLPVFAAGILLVFYSGNLAQLEDHLSSATEGLDKGLGTEAKLSVESGN